MVLKLSSTRVMNIAWALMCVSFLVGFMSRIGNLCRLLIFWPMDQVRDAFVEAGMWKGIWPSLGPTTDPLHGIDFSLPPLYYYFLFPFSLLGPDPIFQALPNALCSLFSIPLLIFALHSLLGDAVPRPRRLFFAALGGLWWSVMLNDITHATKEYNPSPIPFFLLLFALIAASVLRRSLCDRTALLCWCVLGALLALLMSLHATTLYITPVIFTILAGAFILRAESHARAAAFVSASLGVAALCLFPYWLGEIHDGWHNSRTFFLNTIHGAGKLSPMHKIDNAFLAYMWLAGQDYFLSDSVFFRMAGLLFILVIPYVAYSTFRGDRVLSAVLACIWLVFLCAASERSAWEVRYRFPIIMAPIFLCISSLAFLDYGRIRNRVAGCLLMLGLIGSITSNVLMDITHETYVFGSRRAISVADMIDSLKRLPPGAALCGVWDGDKAYAYLDTYIAHRSVRFKASCDSGDYEIVRKNTGWQEFVDSTNYALSYTRSLGYAPAPPPSAGARVLFQNEALSLVLRGSRS